MSFNSFAHKQSQINRDSNKVVYVFLSDKGLPSSRRGRVQIVRLFFYLGLLNGKVSAILVKTVPILFSLSLVLGTTLNRLMSDAIVCVKNANNCIN